MAAKSTGQVVGQTKDVGFQIGVRRTLATTPQAAWDLLTSPTGRKAWLGAPGYWRAPRLVFEPGRTYRTKDGATGEVRVVDPGSHLRLTWQPPGWEKPSLIQVRVIPSGGKTAISFHQEHLRGPAERVEMRARWARALDELERRLTGD
jgi:uncharacterized protein YndB with AHSA1/START domain